MRARVALALALLAAGCASPHAQTPEASRVAPPPAWRTALPGAAAVDADWWNAFGDPVLANLVARALRENDDIAIAATRVEEARGQLRLARAQLSPELGAGASGAEGRQLSGLGVPYTALAGQPQLTISYDLDLFGRLRSASAASRAQALASEASRDTIRLAVASSLASGYVTLRALDERLDVARETLAARAEGLRIARRRAETGYTSALELHQAESEYKAAEQLVPQAELAVSRQENALSLLLGAASGPIPRGKTLDALRPPPVPDGLPADLLRRRPDLYQAEQNLVAADRSLDSARAALLPDVALTGSAGLLLSTALANPIGVFSLGGSILAPIFDAGRRRAGVDVATARRDQAAFTYRRSALQAFREVNDSLAGVLRSREQAVALAGQRDALAAALSNASKRYRAGYSSYLEQLDAQRGLLSAQLALIQARADALNANVTLVQAFGGGWPRP